MSVRKELLQSGNKVDQIPVELSYQIIKHFSAGLYTSPNKAIEELVANSYDALATSVHVILPDNLASPDAIIWVVDNGESMDFDGFRELWRIGESSKRNPNKESKDRPPIGKFGIGKLATYVLAKELTYVCRTKDGYHAVSMDFAKLEEKPERKKFDLAARKLSSDEAKQILQPVLDTQEKNPLLFTLFGKNAARTWTVAALGNLTPMAQKLQKGRLEYVLETALPLNPDFVLFLNDRPIISSKIQQSRLSEWRIGKKDKIADELDCELVKLDNRTPAVQIANLGPIWGSAEIFEDPLQGGKAAQWGRSHGFFVLVRNRVINLQDELFGLEALSHGAFSRFRMVVHADGLDEYLRATRESVSEEEEGVKNFRAYIKSKFNEARSFYDTWSSSREAERSVSGRVSRSPRTLSRQPLVNAVRALLSGKITRLRYTIVPPNLTPESTENLLSELQKRLEEDDFFKDVQFESLGIDKGLAIFDVGSRCFRVNTLHPFFANYCEHYKNYESFQLLAITEVLTEAYLLEEGLTEDQVEHVMNRRDLFLRELVYSTQLAPPLVAVLLDDKRSDPKGLEDAVFEGMKSLRFEARKLGQRGEPDGLAFARLGVRNIVTGQNESYSFTYEAKSTEADRVSGKDVDFAAVQDHQRKYKADFALVVAPGFQGDGQADSKNVRLAVQHKITLITVDDFIALVLVAATRPLTFDRLRDEFFGKCRGPRDAKAWIESLLSENLPVSPLHDMLQTIWTIEDESPDAPKFSAVRERLALSDPKYKSLREADVKSWIESAARLSTGLIYISGDMVTLNIEPEAILDALRQHTSRLPEAYVKNSMYADLLQPRIGASQRPKGIRKKKP